MKDITKHYSTEELTITWRPALCIHSGICAKGLPAVFNPKEKPWIKPMNAGTEELMKLIDHCPSGALSYTTKQTKQTQQMENTAVKIRVAAGGPLLVNGTCTIIDASGTETTKEGMFALCRCGESKNKPYCDGGHKAIDFDK